MAFSISRVVSVKLQDMGWNPKIDSESVISLRALTFLASNYEGVTAKVDKDSSLEPVKTWKVANH